jgi:hypothetical protein
MSQNWQTFMLFQTVRTLHEINACTAIALTVSKVTAKVKQTLYRPGENLRVPACWGSQISRQLAHECGTVVTTMHWPPLSPGNIPGAHFCWRLSRPQGHGAAGRIMSRKNSSDTLRTWTHDLPACSAVPLRTPMYLGISKLLMLDLLFQKFNNLASIVPSVLHVFTG